jgi:ATP-binding cassette, subfamily C (CFTR/MRP), member 1
MVPKSGVAFHYTLLNTVLRLGLPSDVELDSSHTDSSFSSAPMSFFSKTDSGVIVNRFSQDLQLIDMELPVAALNTFASRHTLPGHN